MSQREQAIKHAKRNPYSRDLHPRTQARRAAIRALTALENSDLPLAAALAEERMSPAAQPFARELVSGVCRTRSKLDLALKPLLKKPLQKLDAPVRAALRLAAYERIVLSIRIEAVADEYAESMRALHLKSAVGFVNAVARRLPAEFPTSPSAANNLVQYLRTEYSHPRWIIERWLKVLGEEETRKLCEANNQQAPLSLRVNTLRATTDEILQSLQEREISVRRSEYSNVGLIIEGEAKNFQAWPEWTEGKILAQDEGAQLVGVLCKAQPGWTVIDACSAPGGKTAHLAAQMQNQGKIIACDLSENRLKLVEENAQRLGITILEKRIGDFRALSTQLPAADLVLLDAPCLGTGTWRRRPDARWRKTPEQLEELAQLQRGLLDAAAKVVKQGGYLVYSTCSLEPEENALQARDFLQRHPSWTLESASRVLDERVCEGDLAHTWPQRHDCDGMFGAKFKRGPEN